MCACGKRVSFAAQHRGDKEHQKEHGDTKVGGPCQTPLPGTHTHARTHTHTHTLTQVAAASMHDRRDPGPASAVVFTVQVAFPCPPTCVATHSTCVAKKSTSRTRRHIVALRPAMRLLRALVACQMPRRDTAR